MKRSAAIVMVLVIVLGPVAMGLFAGPRELAYIYDDSSQVPPYPSVIPAD
jgi:hypothetical protein